jgi:hypothetical protein
MTTAKESCELALTFIQVVCPSICRHLSLCPLITIYEVRDLGSYGKELTSNLLTVDAGGGSFVVGLYTFHLCLVVACNFGHHIVR